MERVIRDYVRFPWLDTSVPGFPELDEWPTVPVPPFRLHDFGRYSDPDPWCTVYVELRESAGTVYLICGHEFVR